MPVRDPLVALTGPYVLVTQSWARYPDRDAILFGGAATGVLVACTVASFLLWARLPAALDRAFHAGDEG